MLSLDHHYSWCKETIRSLKLPYLELALEGRLSISDDKKHMVDVVSDTPIGDEILDECLARVASAKRRQRASTWVSRFSGIKRLRHRVAEGLCRKGVLRDQEDQVLLIFKRTVYPEVDGGPEKDLRERMKKAIFTATTDLDPRTVVIIALAQAAGMLNKVFPKRKLKEQKKRIEQLTSGQLEGKATNEAVQAVQAAIMVAAIMPAIFVVTN